jgi:hypothetical protein
MKSTIETTDAVPQNATRKPRKAAKSSEPARAMRGPSITPPRPRPNESEGFPERYRCVVTLDTMTATALLKLASKHEGISIESLIAGHFIGQMKAARDYTDPTQKDIGEELVASAKANALDVSNGDPWRAVRLDPTAEALLQDVLKRGVSIKPEAFIGLLASLRIADWVNGFDEFGLMEAEDSIAACHFQMQSGKCDEGTFEK